MTPLELAAYLRSLTPRKRAELLHTAQLTEAAASASLAKDIHDIHIDK